MPQTLCPFHGPLLMSSRTTTWRRLAWGVLLHAGLMDGGLRSRTLSAQAKDGFLVLFYRSTVTSAKCLNPSTVARSGRVWQLVECHVEIVRLLCKLV